MRLSLDTGRTFSSSSKIKYIGRELYKSRFAYIMIFPVLAYYILFHYVPMYGVVIAFKNYRPFLGILGSPWVGFEHFVAFFQSYYFWRLIRNTILLSLYDIVFHFPAPIILALLLNEVKGRFFKRTVQTISYLPHFVSLVVIIGLMLDFFSTDGLVNSFIRHLGGQTQSFLGNPSWFRSMYVGSGVWQQIGWNSIIYLATLSSINIELYESAVVDGAGRWKQLVHITIPGIASTIIILLILRMGQLMSVGFEKVLLMQNSANIETSDVIATFVYRKGLLESDFSYSTAVGLFNSAINFGFLVAVNKLSRRFSETSLW